MFSGGDSSDGLNNLNQFGSYGFVNQVAVSNAMAAGQNIDWAQLAQQWIQMRDNNSTTIGTNLEPHASANKTITDLGSCNNNSKFEEKGEADMDMDDEEQTDEKEPQEINNDIASSSTNVVHDNQSWIFNKGNSSKMVLRPINNSGQWNSWPNRAVLPQSMPNQIKGNLSSRPPIMNPTSHIPSLLKMNVPHPNEINSVIDDNVNQIETTNSVMDAAKRKGLPAWIREGLEKMEREKQKQLEKEQQRKDKSTSDDDKTANNLLNKSTNSLNVPNLILDEESIEKDDIAIKLDAYVENDENNEDDDSYSYKVGKTYEQKIADLMVIVRRTLTELLLEATNEEISKVADETIKTYKTKASSVQVIRKSALSTLTGKLGLAAYGDSSSDDNSDDENDFDSLKKIAGQSESENDSEEEIRNIIRIKRRAFIKTSEEIEERVACAAAREEEKLIYYLRKEDEEEKELNRKKHERYLLKDSSSSGHSGNKGYEKDFGEITETKIQHLNGKLQRDRSSRRERTTRFSDNKDKYTPLPNVATFLTNINKVTTNSDTVGNVTALQNNSQCQNMPDINGLLPNYTNVGVVNVLNAADAALDKVFKGKSSVSPEKQSKRHDRDRNYTPSRKKQRRSSESKKSRSRSKSSSSSSSSTSSSSDSDSSSSSRSSYLSKYNRRSSNKKKSSERKYKNLRKDKRIDHKHYSSSMSQKKDCESKSKRYHRNASSDSEEDYHRRHKYDSHYSQKSSHSRSYLSSRRDRDRDRNRDYDREHSRSQSRSSYSSSSNRRQ
ncbi:uncharacterized protein ACRADG_000783 [Cochliomyia hominivorax]